MGESPGNRKRKKRRLKKEQNGGRGKDGKKKNRHDHYERDASDRTPKGFPLPGSRIQNYFKMRNFRCGFNPISIADQRLHGTGCKRLAFPPIATAVSDKLSQSLRWLFRVPGKKRTP